jgi:hypothetical protein
MTDQPITYWGSPDGLRITDPIREDGGICCLITPSGAAYGLDRDDARSLGYALIARATVTSASAGEALHDCIAACTEPVKTSLVFDDAYDQCMDHCREAYEANN